MFVWNACLLIAAAGFLSEVPDPIRSKLMSTNETYGVFALKELILIAKKLGIITQGVDENNAFGDGTELAVNQILKRGGYVQNGIAGYGLIKYLASLIKGKI